MGPEDFTCFLSILYTFLHTPNTGSFKLLVLPLVWMLCIASRIKQAITQGMGLSEHDFPCPSSLTLQASITNRKPILQVLVL